MKPAAFVATQGSLFFLKQISEIDTSLIITSEQVSDAVDGY